MIYLYETAIIALIAMVLWMALDLWRGQDRSGAVLHVIIFGSLFVMFGAIPFLPDGDSVPDARTGPTTVVQVR